MNIQEIQSLIRNENADVWVMVDYENRNPNVVSLLGKCMLTRKVVLVLPAEGKPIVICHSIDAVFLKNNPDFDLRIYQTWNELLAEEKEVLLPFKTVMMDISEQGLLPRVSLADYGSVDYVKNLGKTVVSSADLLQSLTAVLSEKQYVSQLNACEKALKIKDEAFAYLAKRIREKGESNEYEIQQFIARRFTEENMVFDEAPIVAIGANATDPHYGPTAEKFSPIKKGDLVLIDMWAKNDEPDGVYADITWMAYVGESVPEIYAERFAIIKEARDAVIAFLTRELSKRKVQAYEADDVARQVIASHGYGKYFIHRLGHNIADDVSPHGPGANLDNFESHDFRTLLEGTSFSDEPGIYAPDFGMRTETDLHIKDGQLVVIAGQQEEIVPLLK